ncbi:hypothetical protein COOONC_03948 [Cooperia oncophora]
MTSMLDNIPIGTNNDKYSSPYEKLQSCMLFAATVTVIALMITTMAIIIFCAWRITAAVKKNSCVTTRRLDLQLRRTLFAQAASPLLLLHLPFYISVLAPLFDARTGEVSNYFPFLFSWCPVINPLITLYFVKDFRLFVLGIFMRKKIATPPSTTLRTKNAFCK